MKNIRIRKAIAIDIDTIMSIYDAAAGIRESTGTPTKGFLPENQRRKSL